MQSTHHHKQLRLKRETYRRSQTLTASPASLSLQPRSTSQQQQQQGTELAAAAVMPSQSQPVLSQSSSRTSRGSVSSISVDPQLHTPTPVQSSRRHVLGRAPSSPSVLLSRMRELIREKVVETTVHRSDLAAVERERRQRATDAFVESLRQQQEQQEHRHSSGSVDVTTPPGLMALSSSFLRRNGVRRHRTGSDPASSWLRRCSPGPEVRIPSEIGLPLQSMAGSTNVTKAAFREHRSTSEDTSSWRQRTTTRRLSHAVASCHRSKGTHRVLKKRVLGIT